MCFCLKYGTKTSLYVIVRIIFLHNVATSMLISASVSTLSPSCAVGVLRVKVKSPERGYHSIPPRRRPFQAHVLCCGGSHCKVHRALYPRYDEFQRCDDRLCGACLSLCLERLPNQVKAIVELGEQKIDVSIPCLTFLCPSRVAAGFCVRVALLDCL